MVCCSFISSSINWRRCSAAELIAPCACLRLRSQTFLFLLPRHPAQVLKDNGGAIKVTAGGSFCAALTRSGQVVLWGQPRGAEGMAAPPAAALATAAAQPGGGGRRRRGFFPVPRPAGAAAPAASNSSAAAAAGGNGAPAGSSSEKAVSEEIPNMRIQKQGGVLVAEITGLPPMKDVAAGFTHISITDGASVWTVGR